MNTLRGWRLKRRGIVTIKECKFKINKLQNEIDYIESTEENKDRLEDLISKIDSLKKWLEREIENIKTNGSKLDKIIYYREDDSNKYTWEQISNIVHYSTRQTKRIYYKYKKAR